MCVCVCDASSMVFDISSNDIPMLRSAMCCLTVETLLLVDHIEPQKTFSGVFLPYHGSDTIDISVNLTGMTQGSRYNNSMGVLGCVENCSQ